MPAAIAGLSPSLRRLLTLAGAAAAIAGVGFVGVRLYRDFDRLPPLSSDPLTVSTVLLAICVYAAAGILLAAAWRLLLRVQGIDAGFLGAVRIYGVSQLAKYVPGNVVQFAGRQALAMTAGMPAGAVAVSALAEIGLLVAAGCLLGMPALGPDFLAVVSGVVLLVLAAAVPLLGGRPAWLATAFLCQAAFLVFAALAFVLVLAAVTADPVPVHQNLAAIGGGYIAAWLVGLLTPGAPSGIGVRELTLTLLLEDLVPGESLLAAVVLSRAVTMLGDLLFFLGVQPLPAAGARR